MQNFAIFFKRLKHEKEVVPRFLLLDMELLKNCFFYKVKFFQTVELGKSVIKKSF